jgi:hypothetical protein
MSIILTLANYLKSIDRQRIIYDRVSKDPYLERYYILFKDRTWFPFNMFLHKFLRSDPDAQHDHPWNYMTIILKGGYWEWIPTYNIDGIIDGERRVWRGAGHMRRCKAGSFHRIEVEPNVDCWTLFIPGKRCRDWGFLDHDGSWNNQVWIPNEEYIAKRTNDAKAA